MDITKDTSLGDFTSKELTESSAIQGDFDHASLNYSGQQNIQARAETFRAYDDAISDRQRYKIQELGGKVDSSMNRSEAWTTLKNYKDVKVELGRVLIRSKRILGMIYML